MAAVRKFRPLDLLSFNLVNLDPLTETYNFAFYAHYFVRWPWYQRVVHAPDGTTAAYILGKSEGAGKELHGHVSAVTVAPGYRRIGLGRTLMRILERFSDEQVRAYFVDLFVRVSNTLAVNMYRRFGYEVYRTVLGYYSDDEDAYDMRKALSRDPARASLRCPASRRRVRPSELAFN